MVSLIQKNYFDALLSEGKNRKWFGTKRNRSSPHIRLNNNESHTKRACSKLKMDLN